MDQKTLRMSRCPGCHTENDAQARYCGQCGTALAPASAQTPSSRSSASGRIWMLAVLTLVGLGFAGAIGYWLGVSHAATLTTETESASTSADAAAGSRASPPREAATSSRAKRHLTRRAPADGNDSSNDEADTEAPASPERRLALLREALAQCSKFNIFCQEKARWKYCSGWWGKAPECPQANPGIQAR